MIFVTVGEQLPFDRLIKTLDEWAGSRNRKDIVAQTGKAEYIPEHFEWTKFVSQMEFIENIRKADIVISHAGIGTILTALELRKPILVMPRRAYLHEHRNDHQVRTALHLLELGCISAAFDERELRKKLDNIEKIRFDGNGLPNKLPQLLETVRDFINNG